MGVRKVVNLANSPQLCPHSIYIIRQLLDLGSFLIAQTPDHTHLLDNSLLGCIIQYILFKMENVVNQISPTHLL